MVGSAIGGLVVVNAGPLMSLNVTDYAVTTDHELGEGDQQPPGQIVAGTLF